MQLQPTEQFTISRQLADPDDIDTNYVQATVRNAKTDALLKTISLSNKGSQRFTAVYEVPADVSGEGFWITITTLVYANAGYTVRNPNYNAEQSTYLVQDRPNKLQNGGGSGADVDYKKITKIIDGIVNPPEDPKAKEKKEGPLAPVIALLNKSIAIGEAINAKELPETPKPSEPVDLTPVLSALSDVLTAIRDIPDKVPKTELEPLQSAVNDLTDAIKITLEKHDALAEENYSILSDEVKRIQGDLKALGNIEKTDYKPLIDALAKTEGVKGTAVNAIEGASADVSSHIDTLKKPVDATSLKEPILSPFNIKRK